MTLTEIKWIAVLYETGNISKAAENLFVSQSALSQCLKRVEEQLGFQLFHRIGKRIVPTKKAELFNEMAKNVLESYDQFLRKANSIEAASLNEIYIALPAAINELVNGMLLKELSTLHPNIKFKIYEASAEEMWNGLIQKRVDLIAINGPRFAENVVAYPFAESEIIIYLRSCSSAAKHIYNENGMTYLDPVYLKDEPMALMRKGHTSRTVADALFTCCGFEPIIVQESKSVQTLYRCAEVGIGSAINFLLPNLESSKTEKVIPCRIPPKYELSKTQSAVYVLSEREKDIPNDVFETICGIIKNALLKKK